VVLLKAPLKPGDVAIIPAGWPHFFTGKIGAEDGGPYIFTLKGMVDENSKLRDTLFFFRVSDGRLGALPSSGLTLPHCPPMATPDCPDVAVSSSLSDAHSVAAHPRLPSDSLAFFLPPRPAAPTDDSALDSPPAAGRLRRRDDRCQSPIDRLGSESVLLDNTSFVGLNPSEIYEDGAEPYRLQKGELWSGREGHRPLSNASTGSFTGVAPMAPGAAPFDARLMRSGCVFDEDAV